LCLVKTVFSLYNTGKPLKALTPILRTGNIETPSVTTHETKNGKKIKTKIILIIYLSEKEIILG
jgi:hypothetical protein